MIYLTDEEFFHIQFIIAPAKYIKRIKGGFSQYGVDSIYHSNLAHSESLVSLESPSIRYSHFLLALELTLMKCDKHKCKEIIDHTLNYNDVKVFNWLRMKKNKSRLLLH